MDFDWITWSIWLIGFIVLVVWTWIPIREFRRLVAQRRQASGETPSNAPSSAGENDGSR